MDVTQRHFCSATVDRVSAWPTRTCAWRLMSRGGSHVLPAAAAVPDPDASPCDHPGGHRAMWAAEIPGPGSRDPRRLPSLRWPTPRRSSLIRFFFAWSARARQRDNAGPRPPTPSLSLRQDIHCESLMPCTHAGVVWYVYARLWFASHRRLILNWNGSSCHPIPVMHSFSC